MNLIADLPDLDAVGIGVPVVGPEASSGVSAEPLQYSTQAAASSAEPEPAFTQIIGSQPPPGKRRQTRPCRTG